ncbi:hypothetical protein GQ54DRAFT_239532, partial [Martensiomyces pterosporus]
VVDPGSELNVCDLQWCQEMGLDIREGEEMSVVGVNDQGKLNSGVIRHIPVEIGDISFPTSAVVVSDFKYPLLLGLPF